MMIVLQNFLIDELMTKNVNKNYKQIKNLFENDKLKIMHP